MLVSAMSLEQPRQIVAAAALWFLVGIQILTQIESEFHPGYHVTDFFKVHGLIGGDVRASNLVTNLLHQLHVVPALGAVEMHTSLGRGG